MRTSLSYKEAVKHKELLLKLYKENKYYLFRKIFAQKVRESTGLGSTHKELLISLHFHQFDQFILEAFGYPASGAVNLENTNG